MDSNKVISKMFMWLFAGIFLSFITAFIVSNNPTLLITIFSTSAYYLIFLAELIVVIVFSSRIYKMSKTSATILYLIYSLLTGLTLSCIFVVYEIPSIIFIFGITSLVLLLFSFIGMFTKFNLNKLSSFLLMGLLGIIFCYIVNIFLNSEVISFGTLVFGVIIFILYIAFDTQRVVKNFYGLEEDKLPIMGALELYMDFINLFIRLLELFGKRRD